MQEFTYLGSKITTDGDSGADVQGRINKARGAFAALRKNMEDFKDQHKDKAEDIQEQRPRGSPVWSRIMESDTDHLPQARRIPDSKP